MSATKSSFTSSAYNSKPSIPGKPPIPKRDDLKSSEINNPGQRTDKSKMKMLLAFDPNPMDHQERKSKVLDIKDKMKFKFNSMNSMNQSDLYKNAIEKIDENLGALRKKQFREMLIYKANEHLKTPLK